MEAELAGVRDKLLKLSSNESHSSSFQKKLENRRAMTKLVVDFVRDDFVTKSRRLCAQMQEAGCPPEFAYALFSSLQNTAGEDAGLAGEEAEACDRSKLAKFVFEELNLWVRDASDAKNAKVLLGAMNKGLDVIDDSYVPTVLDEIINTFDNSENDLAHVLEVVPYAVRKLRDSGTSSRMGDAGVSMELPIWCSGAHEGKLNPQLFQTKLVEYICSLNWKPSQAAAIVHALRDLKLQSEDLSRIMRKILVCCTDTELQSIPALVYQLLIASLQLKSDTALRGIAKLFERLENKCWSNPGTTKSGLLAVEGTVLLNINIVAKQKQDMAQTLIRSLRESSSSLKPFLFGMLLSLARITKSEKCIFDYLEGVALAHFSQKSHPMPSKAWVAVTHAGAVVDSSFEDLADEMISRSHHWDVTIPSLVNFGKALIRSAGVGAKDRTALLGGGMRNQENPKLRRMLLGVYILHKVFESHDAVRSDILKQCQQEILNNSDSSIYYIHLLARLCLECKAAVAEYSNLVKECLDCFLIISPSLAVYYFISVLPLAACTADLKNYAVIVLRKAMFSRNYDHRLTAVKCLMHLALADALPDFRAIGFGSQASFSQQSQGSRVGEVCHDLLGFLRKGIKQQYTLRKMLYTGFMELAKAKPELANRAFEMLLPHFHEFYEEDKDLQPPIRLEKCSALVASKFRPVEPLHSLIYCAHNLTLSVSESELTQDGLGAMSCESQKSVLCARLAQDCNTLYQRMLQANLEDFGIDKSMDLDTSSALGQVNLHNCHILRGCLEGMIDMECSHMQRKVGTQHSNAKGLASLFEMYERLLAIMRGRPKPKKDRVDAAMSHFFAEFEERKTTHMRVPSLVYFLDVLRSGEFPHSSPSAGQESMMYTQSTGMKLARSIRFRVFILHQCNAIMETAIHNESHHAKVRLACGGSAQDEDLLESILKVEGYLDWRKMSVPLFTTCETFVLAECNVRRNGSYSQQPKSNQEEAVLLQEACTSIDKLVSVAASASRYLEEFTQLRPAPGQDNAMSGGENLQPSPCLLLWGHLSHLVQKLVEARCFKEAEIMSNAVYTISSCFPKELGKSASHLARRILQNADRDHPGIIRAILRIALCFTSSPADLDFCSGLSQEIGVFLEQAGSQIKSSGARYGQIIGEKTVNGIMQAILSHCSNIVDDLGSVMVKTYNVFDPCVPKRMIPLLEVLAQVCQMGLTGQALVDLIVKMLTKVYKSMGDMAKHMATQKGRAPEAAFVGLCDKQIQELTSAVYSFLEELFPENQSEEEEEEEGKENREKKVLSNRIKKEARRIPNLIYNIEDCERKLIVLSKASGVNLMRNAKRSTARDFKLLKANKQAENTITAKKARIH